MEDLFLQFGYVMVFLVAAVEGEGALLAGAILAHRGQMSFPAAVAAAFLGTFVVSEAIFHFSRTHGRGWIQRKASHTPRLKRVERWLERRGAAIVIWARFLWGVRIWIPAICGVGGMRSRPFLIWNLLGATVWTAIVAPICYFFGGLLRQLPKPVEDATLAVVVVLTIFVMIQVFRKLQRETAP